MAAPFAKDFPKLQDVATKKTSEVDSRYNCIAWAFGDSQRFWWPSKRVYWPFDCDGMTCAEAFKKLFKDEGWLETDSVDVEKGLHKIALFTLNDEPTHAARLLPNGYWTSKLGNSIDISHDLNELDGPTYGAVSKIYCKPI